MTGAQALISPCRDVTERQVIVWAAALKVNSTATRAPVKDLPTDIPTEADFTNSSGF